ncbi:MAG: dihydrodipicolinate reductase [Sulfitobacter sp.]|jgi:hypothetical protein|uniref:dihydrodipicolinate reductase n=1 Tax=Sulfitobacter sp. TaxID=1903071 RepID=UPI000C0E0332|nr:dihydrodipicolinate reductase [Roseobacter sp.]MBV49629.1 dihydrodipicolinate reductase [Roseobacter sp.]PHR03944.1 MAG: dihydrodipicolinate reductase [Sulfitobacter sp.]|tara:strand:- start:500 stop:856 length:357 start_codon:yes stop_codon:yes gene_type:complete
MRHLFFTACVAVFAMSSAAHAEYQKVQSQADFISVVDGKKLTRPLVELEVSPAGTIRGTGAAWKVSGNWVWKEGYFCRSLEWGDDDLGYNCQEVAVNGTKIRFTSDKGTGKSASFSLR